MQVNSLCGMVTRDLAVTLPMFAFSLQTNLVVTPWAHGRSSQHSRESLDVTYAGSRAFRALISPCCPSMANSISRCG